MQEVDHWQWGGVSLSSQQAAEAETGRLPLTLSRSQAQGACPGRRGNVFVWHRDSRCSVWSVGDAVLILTWPLTFLGTDLNSDAGEVKGNQFMVHGGGLLFFFVWSVVLINLVFIFYYFYYFLFTINWEMQLHSTSVLSNISVFYLLVWCKYNWKSNSIFFQFCNYAFVLINSIWHFEFLISLCWMHRFSYLNLFSFHNVVAETTHKTWPKKQSFLNSVLKIYFNFCFSCGFCFM